MATSTPMVLFREVCRRPLMFLSSSRYEAVVAFIHGYDVATGGGALRGFEEYLRCQCAELNNLPWWLVVRRLAEPDADVSGPVLEEDDLAMNAALGSQLEGFMNELERAGLAKVYWEYVQWLSSRTDQESQYLFRRIVQQCEDDSDHGRSE